MSATRARVLAALASFRPKEVHIEELGGIVYVRPVTVGGMSKIHATLGEATERMVLAQKKHNEAPTPESAKDLASATEASRHARDRSGVLLMLDCLVDEDNKRLFSDDEEALVSSFPGSVAESIHKAIEQIRDTVKEHPDAAAGN